MHTIWKGNVTFGLINIGIKLHSAIEDKDIKLKSLHKDCLTPIKYQKVSPDCSDKTLTDADIVKAYEYAKDKYVVINDSEIQGLKKEYEVKTVEVVDFINLDEIDPTYYNNTYYLAPEEGQSRAYSLLRKALSESNKVGIAKISMRSSQQLAVIRTFKDALILETIHYPDEVRPVEGLSLHNETVDEKELAVAKMLIDQLTTTFEPAKYKNEYRSALMDLIESKVEGEQIDIPETIEPKKENVMSLMDILQASLERTKPEALTDKTTKPKPKPKKKRATTKKAIL